MINNKSLTFQQALFKIQKHRTGRGLMDHCIQFHRSGATKGMSGGGKVESEWGRSPTFRDLGEHKNPTAPTPHATAAKGTEMPSYYPWFAGTN